MSALVVRTRAPSRLIGTATRRCYRRSRQQHEQQADEDDRELTLAEPVSGSERRRLVLPGIEPPAWAWHDSLLIQSGLAVDVAALGAAVACERRAGERLTNPAIRIDRARQDRPSVGARNEELDGSPAAVGIDEGLAHPSERHERRHHSAPRSRGGADDGTVTGGAVDDRAEQHRAGRDA